MSGFDGCISALAAKLGVADDSAAVADALSSRARSTRLAGGGRDAVERADRIDHLAQAIRTRQAGEATAIQHTRDVLELLA